MAYNEGFWQKAYVIEFQINNIVQDAFTFSYPPQSEEFSFPQRINETKTFGGTVFDDYGNDTVNITLSGTTVNQEIKTIYCSSKGKKYLNGEDEIFYLQKLVKEYGKIKNLKNKSVILYELKSNAKAISTKWWVGRIKDFTIKRSKDAPMSYFYTLNFIGAPEGVNVKKERTKWLKKVFNWLDNEEEGIHALLKKLDGGLDFLESGLQYITEVKDLITSIRKSMRDVGDKLQQYIDTVMEYGQAVNDVITEAGILINDTTDLFDQFSKQVIRHTLSTGLSIYNSSKELVANCKNLSKFFNDFDIEDFTADILEEFDGSPQEVKSECKEQAKSCEDIANAIETLAINLNDKKKPVIIPGSEGEDDKVITTYGYQLKQVKKGDNWDKLALEYYGDANMGNMLASYNASYNDKLKDITELEAGQYIYFPILSEDKIKNTDNLVFITKDQKDIYGTDIDISNKDFELKNGDYVFVNNKENLAQAINNRLSVVVGSKIRDEVYGIRTNIGDIPEASSFILASIESTLQEEPRIQSVENIQFKTEKGQLFVNIEYTDINDNVNMFNTVI